MPATEPPSAPTIALAFVVLAILVVFSVAATARAALDARPPGAPGKPRALIARFLALAAAWIALWLGIASSGVLARFELRPPPAVLMFVAITVAAVTFARSALGRALAEHAPIAALVGLQAFRLPLELAMDAAAHAGVMPIQMSFEGRNFDIVTGALALVLGLVATRRTLPRAALWAFQLVGIGLLVNILVVAMASTPLFRAFGDDPSVVNTFVAHPPYVLLPTVMVLAAIALHIVLAMRMRAVSAGPNRVA